MSNVEQARDLDRLQSLQLLDRLNLEQRDAIKKIDAEMRIRGFSKSGPRHRAVWQTQVAKFIQAIDGRVDIRRNLARSIPELASNQELDTLLEDFIRMISNLAAVPQANRGVRPQPGSAVVMSREQQNEAWRLRAHAKMEIEILKKEFALKLHEREAESSTAITVETGGGPSVVNLGTVYGDVQQVISHVNEAGQKEIADTLRRLAKAISEAENLADERAELLHQIRFIAEQSALPPQSRQTSVVKVVWIALQARLHDVAAIAQILSVAGPVVANHYGFKWPM